MTKWGGPGEGEAVRLGRGAPPRSVADKVREVVWLHSVCLVKPSGS